MASAAAGRSGALVLSAAPGAGRTALLDVVSASARSWTVVSAAGHRDECGLPYAGWQNLITPLSDLADQLEPAQRVALRRGLAGRQGDRLALGRATLSLWGAAARRRPLLCVLDDAHLLDPESWRTVLVAARRASRERLVVLASVTAGAETGGLPVRRVGALSAEAAREVVARRAPDVAAEVAAALIEMSGGNPGVLTDLAESLSAEQRRGLVALPEVLPVGSALRGRYREVLAGLSERARGVVLVAAATPQAPVDVVLAATADLERFATGSGSKAFKIAEVAEVKTAEAERVRVAEAEAEAEAAEAGRVGLAEVERAGLVEVRAQAVGFVSPLVRDCLFAEAPVGWRRAAHGALARVLAARGEHLPALLHRAAAANGPDALLARQLARSARSAEPAVAAEARACAATLCADPGERGAMLVDAARSAWLAGRPHDAGLLIRRVPTTAGTARVRARALTAEMRLPEGRPGARDLLLDVAADLSETDTAAALEALALAGEAAAEPSERGRYAGLARRVAARQRGDESPAMALAFQHVGALAALADGDEQMAFARFRRTLDLADRVTDPGLLTRAATAGILVGDGRRAAALAGRAAVLAAESGAKALEPRALELVALAGMASGDYAAANEAALDGAAVARATGQRVLAGAHVALLAVLAALVGDREDALRRIAESGGGPTRPMCGWALALLDLVDGRFPAATERLVSVVTAAPGYGSALLQVAVVPHLLEAVAQTGPEPATQGGRQPGQGGRQPGTGGRQAGTGGRQPGTGLGLAAVASGFDRWAGRTGQPTWLALRDRCRALRADDVEAAEGHFADALGHIGEAGFPRAHTELLYGRFLRRRRRHVEARTQLRRAAETFRLLDAEPWAAQSVRELRAAGERVEQPAPALNGLELTAQQERIATLVAGGATNREVAQELHLSPRTVDHHLRNVFARLGVRSRTEMAHLLGGR